MLIPLKVDVPIDRRPWVNWTIIAATIVISVVAWTDESLLESFAGFGRSCMVHMGPLHLLGNMLFLWVFGNAVNYKFGHLGYLWFYVAVALAGDGAHALFGEGIAIGASGAINGVMGAYLVFFPRNQVTVLWLIWTRAGIGHVAGIWIILFWVAWDVLYLALGADMGVAYWAHVGGFATGFVIALLCAASGLIKPTEDEQMLLQGRR